MRGRQDVVGGQHQDPSLGLSLGRQRQMDSHLVAVEVGVEGVAHQRVYLDRLALDQHRLERLDTQTMERGCAVEQHRMLGDHLFEHVPDLGHHRVDHLLGRLDVLDELALDQPAHDERLEQLQRHQLGQSALVQAQRRAGHDHRTAGVVDALAQEVLTEATLLALEHVGQRLQRPVARAGHRATAAAVVEEGVNRLLQHPLLVVDDDLGSAQIEQALEPVVAVDHAPVEIVEIRGGEAATVQLHHRAQLRRNHRDRLQDHPLRAVVALDEGVDHLQALDRAGLLLSLGGADRLAQQRRLGVEVAGAQKLTNGLGAHAAGEVLTEAPRATEPVAQLPEQGLVSDDLLYLELLELDPGAIQPVDRILGVVVHVLAPSLHVVVGVAHLQRPGLDHADVVARHLAVGAQAQIVGQLAQLGLVGRGALLHDLAQQAGTDLAGLVQRRSGAGTGLDQLGHPLGVGLLEVDLVAAQEAQPRLQGIAGLGALGALQLLHRVQLGADQRACSGRPCGHVVELLGAEPAILTDRGLTHQLLDLARDPRRRPAWPPRPAGLRPACERRPAPECRSPRPSC